MKKKSLAGILSLLICIALIGVGFASWVITAGDTETATGNVTVETVEDKRLSITTTWEDEKSTIVFGQATDTTGVANSWLKASDDIQKEVLSVTLNIVVANMDSNDTISVVFNPSDEDKYNAALVSKYITGPAVGEELTCTKVSTGNYTCELEFAWGEAFENKNPYIFFNSNNVLGVYDDKDDDDTTNDVTYGDYALESINNLYNLNALTFELTVTATAVDGE